MTERPVFHQTDEAIRGHVFCSFLALLFQKPLRRRRRKVGVTAGWEEVLRDLKAVQQTEIAQGRSGS